MSAIALANLERWRAARRSCSNFPARSARGVRWPVMMSVTMAPSPALLADSWPRAGPPFAEGRWPAPQTCWCQANHRLWASLGACSRSPPGAPCRHMHACFRHVAWTDSICTGGEPILQGSDIEKRRPSHWSIYMRAYSSFMAEHKVASHLCIKEPGEELQLSCIARIK